MTDHELAKQIVDAVGSSLERLTKKFPEASEELQRFIAGEYLTAHSQMAEFLCKKDGEVSPQQFTRAVKVVGERLGYARKPRGM